MVGKGIGWAMFAVGTLGAGTLARITHRTDILLAKILAG